MKKPKPNIITINDFAKIKNCTRQCVSKHIGSKIDYIELFGERRILLSKKTMQWQPGNDVGRPRKK